MVQVPQLGVQNTDSVTSTWTIQDQCDHRLRHPLYPDSYSPMDSTLRIATGSRYYLDTQTGCCTGVVPDVVPDVVVLFY